MTVLFVNFRDDTVVTLPNGWTCLSCYVTGRAQHTNKRVGCTARGMAQSVQYLVQVLNSDQNSDLKPPCKKSASVSNARGVEAVKERP